MYISSSILKKNYPTISEATKALVSADNIDVESRNSRDLNSILRKISSIDPKIKGLVKTRKTGVLAYNQRLFGETTIDLNAVLLRNKRNIKKIKDLVITTSLYGSALAKIERAFNAEKNYWQLSVKKIDNADFEAINENRFGVYDDSGNITKFDYDQVKSDWIYLYDGAFERGGDLRSIMFYSILKNETYKIWSEFNENSRGIVVLEYDTEKLSRAEATTGNQNLLKDAVNNLDIAVANLSKKGYIKAPAGISAQLAKMVDGVANASFKNIIAEFDSAISTAIVGQSNTNELPNNGGSRAAVQILNLIKADIIYNDMNDSKDAIDDFLLIDYQVNNNQAAKSLDYEFEFIYDDVSDVVSNATMFQILGQSGIKIKVLTKELYSKIDMTMPDDAEEFTIIGENVNTII